MRFGLVLPVSLALICVIILFIFPLHKIQCFLIMVLRRTLYIFFYLGFLCCRVRLLLGGLLAMFKTLFLSGAFGMGVNSATDNKQIDSLENSQTVTDTDVVDFYESCLESIKFYIDPICREYKIDDLVEVSQNQFEAVLKVLGRRLFKNNPEIRRDTNYADDNLNSGSYYDIDKLYIILDIYYFLCGIYNKAVSVMGFSSLVGMSVLEFYNWRNGMLLTNIHLNFAKTLKELRQESLTNILTTAKRNPVGLLGILNHEFNWSMPGVTKEKTVKVAVDASQLPDLGAKKQIETHGEQPQVSDILDTVKINA